MAAATTGYGATDRKDRPGTGIRIGGALAAVVLLMSGYWIAGQMTAPTALEGYGAGWTPINGGMLKLGRITKLKPGNTTPEGFIRFAVTATVAAGDKQLIISASSFRIDGVRVYQGMEPVKASPTVERIKPGKRATMRLVYQVTEYAGDFSLIFEGGKAIPFQVNGSDR